MKNKKFKLMVSLFTVGILTLGCGNSSSGSVEDGGGTTTTDPNKCETTWSNNTDWQELCVPTAGVGRHYRIQSLDYNSAFSSFGYIILAQDDGTPAGNPVNPVAADGKFIYTFGRSNTPNGYNWVYARFGGETNPSPSPSAPTYGVIGDPVVSDTCFDISAATPPKVTVWVTGHNGADCGDKGALTAGTAAFTKDDWTDATALNTTRKNYVKTSNANVTMGKVTVSTELALTP